jgi:hypothetical protein
MPLHPALLTTKTILNQLSGQAHNLGGEQAGRYIDAMIEAFTFLAKNPKAKEDLMVLQCGRDH